MNEKNSGKLELLAQKNVNTYDELYIIVDFLNKTLKDKNLMFGLTKNSAKEIMTISVYEV